MKPTFIGIGAQKCASTWLHRVLEEHPDVGVGSEKELDFFSYHYDHGYQWYESQFEIKEDRQAIGEISPSYFCEAGVPERIKKYAPDARIIVSFRDPVQRALSNHRHEVRVGHLTGSDLTFEAGLKNNPMYVEQGLYAKHLERWHQYFSKEQVLVVLQEDIAASPHTVAKQVYSFIGVDDSYEPEVLDRKFNRSYANRSHNVAAVKDRLYALTSIKGVGWVWSLASALGVRSLYRRFNTMPSDLVIPEPNRETLAELRECFDKDVRRLSDLIGRDLKSWL